MDNQTPSNPLQRAWRQLRRHRRLILLFILAGLAYLFSQYGLLQVTVSNPAGTSVNYRLTNQGDKKTATFTGGKSITRLVHKGSYEIIANQSGKNGFVVVQTRGFFRKTSRSLELKPERQRQFIGDNPDSCMHFNRILFSYACNGPANTFTAHVAATSTQPTLAHKGVLRLDGTIEGVLATKEGSVVLLRANIDEGSALQVFYLLNNKQQVVDRVPAYALDPQQLYGVKPYTGGFIVYDQSFSHVLRFTNFRKPPQEITVPAAQQADLRPIALDANPTGDIAVMFSNNSSDADERAAKDIRNTLVFLRTDNTVQQFNLNKKDLGRFAYCARDRLCILNDTDLEVYHLNNKTLDLDFRLVNVDDIRMVGERVLASQGKYLINLDVVNHSGAIDYSYGAYNPCGLSTAPNGYLLCVYDQNSNRHALLVNTKEDNTDSIDKKVAGLLTLPQIRTVSAYKTFIFISANLGRLVADPKTGDFGYDPAVSQATKTAINQKLDELGISRTAYRVVIPLLN